MLKAEHRVLPACLAEIRPCPYKHALFLIDKQVRACYHMTATQYMSQAEQEERDEDQEP